MGKACVRFKKLDDLALDVIGESIRRVSARGFIQYYESVIKNSRSRSGKGDAAKSKSVKSRAARAKRRK